MRQLGVSLPFTRTMKILIGLNIGIWLLGQVIVEHQFGIQISKYFALFPGKVIFDGALWQVFTYQFLHTLQVSHVLLNMLMLWFMGAELEQTWGSKFFLFYYLMSGLGAGVIYTLAIWAHASWTGASQNLVVPVMGASGSIFGLMMAYGILYGERTIHFMMIFPMKAKFFVMILAGIEIISMLTNGIAGAEVANLAHLGGLVSGYLILTTTTWWKRRNGGTKGRKAKKKGTQLRLVVDNEKSSAGDEPPKYWN